MPDSRDTQLPEVAVLTRAVENVFRKLIRLLVGKISLVKIQEMMKIIYIQEAENYIRQEDDLENVSMTKLGVLTGVDTRTLSNVINSEAFRRPIHKEQYFLKELTPAASVVDVWSSEEPYFDSKLKVPRTLPISGEPPSFESLVGETIKARGITASSLLKRLQSCGAIEVNSDLSEVRLVQVAYFPNDVEDYLGFFELGLSAVGNLTETVHYNLKAVEKGEERLYQRGAWTFQLPVNSKEQARQKLSKLLSATEFESRKILDELEDGRSKDKLLTIGVGMYYFEETP